MSKLLYTVDNLVAEIRSMLDELNQDSVDTNRDILPALNRGQDYAFDILARRYPEPILKYSYMQLISDQAEYDIGEDTFEDRILKVEVEIPSGSGNAQYREVQRISYRDLADYESSGQVNIPYYYCIYSRKIKFSVVPTGQYRMRIWKLRNPEKLVLPQGRITKINLASNYIIVDQVGDTLTTEADQLDSYVNIVDGQSGEIKGSLQIQILNDNKMTFRTVPIRNEVLNRDIVGDLSSIDVSEDDYVCAIEGSCVPYYGQPTCNFLIQYGVSEISRKLGGPSDQEEKILDKFEKQVERTWVKRENTLRIKKRSRVWGLPVSRFWYSNRS